MMHEYDANAQSHLSLVMTSCDAEQVPPRRENQAEKCNKICGDVEAQPIAHTAHLTHLIHPNRR